MEPITLKDSVFRSNKKINFRISSVLLFLTGITGIIIIICLDKFFWQTHILPTDTWPDFSPEYLIRSSVILLSVIFMVLGLVGKKKPELILFKSKETDIERFGIFGAILLSIIFLLLFLFRPVAFSIISFEGELLEHSQFLLFLGCIIILSLSLFKTINTLHSSNYTKWVLGLFIIIFFVIAMEEISWFQWILMFEAPELFQEANFQGEVTVHNFATKYFENAYYFGTFIFLVVLPFTHLLFPNLFKNNFLKFLVPNPFIGIIGALACAYNFDMWNVVFIQVTFFGAIVILFFYFLFDKKRSERYFLMFTILLLIVTQGSFLINGEIFFRIFEVTEYKEFFIPLTFFIYSLDVFLQINREYLKMKEVTIINS